jgi:hypothetical protein
MSVLVVGLSHSGAPVRMEFWRARGGQYIR